MARTKHKYPGTDEVEKYRRLASKVEAEDEEPDWIAGAPNFKKYSHMTPEEVLVFFNID